MTSFTSLLSSISGAPAALPASSPAQRHQSPATSSAGAPSKEATLTAANVAAGVKRKPDEQLSGPQSKATKIERDEQRSTHKQNTARPPDRPMSSKAPVAPPRPGTLQTSGIKRPAPAPTQPQNRTAPPASNAVAAPPSTSNDAVKPKRGFASLMEKAKAAQAAAKAVGSSSIKHKPAPKLTKRDRQKMMEEAAKQKTNGKAGKTLGLDRSRSGTPADTKAPSSSKASVPAYRGTMRKPVERQESTYKGTMNRASGGTQSTKSAAKKSLGQDKYGGYASWSDLDDAEDEDDDHSDASSDMMDAGFDDMEAEERRALQAAKKEDQEALEEEERHRREKLERRRKLQALSKSVAAKKRS